MSRDRFYAETLPTATRATRVRVNLVPNLLKVCMLTPQVDSGVAAVFAPRATIDADGTVEGYASLFGEVDQARDMVMRGAFTQTLATRGVRRIPMLFQHDPSEPVGIWLELREDYRGLFARGRLIPEVARGRELLSLLRARAIDGLSIGYRTTKARVEPNTRIRRLLAVDLWEISIVTFPLLNGARVSTVKHAASLPIVTGARRRAECEWSRVASPGKSSQNRTPSNGKSFAPAI